MFIEILRTGRLEEQRTVKKISRFVFGGFSQQLFGFAKLLVGGFGVIVIQSLQADVDHHFAVEQVGLVEQAMIFVADNGANAVVPQAGVFKFVLVERKSAECKHGLDFQVIFFEVQRLLKRSFRVVELSQPFECLTAMEGRCVGIRRIFVTDQDRVQVVRSSCELTGGFFGIAVCNTPSDLYSTVTQSEQQFRNQ